ncbi:MAG: hypothetical protein KJ737_09910 [Proteobacteria bacterium]|nr:hypothetical protein [Pseudomonadota bacterium]
MIRSGYDRRHQNRYRIKNGIYAAYAPTFLRMGPLVDVSLKGFSYCYKSLSETENRGLPDQPELCLRVNDFYLDRISYKIVYMVDSDHHGVSGSGFSMVRYGVQFIDLNPTNENILKQLLQTNTSEKIPDRRDGTNRRTGRNRRKYDYPQFQSEWRQGLDRRKFKDRRNIS